MSELYKKHRPRTLKNVVGQAGALASLQKLLDKGDVPHALLLTGPSGCGKTTIARILKKHLRCGNSDFQEINSSDHRGVEVVRDIRRYMNLAPIEGDCRIWLLDETHKLTNDAQNAFLKMLEDTPDHVYFFLLTTDSSKLIKAVHTRCTEIRLKPLDEDALKEVLLEVIGLEKLVVSKQVLKEIVDAADGSARKALVILEQCGSLEGDDAQLQAVQASSVNKDQAFRLAQLLFNWDRKTTWTDIAQVLRSLSDQDPEGIRYLVLSYARSCLIGKEDKPPNENAAQKAFRVIDYFSENFYDSKQAGLAAACWAVVHTR